MGGPFTPPSAGGGASSDGWEALALASGASTVFAIGTCHLAGTTFTLAAGQHIEVDGFIFKNTGNNGGVIVTVDGSTGFILSVGNDGNSFIDNYSSGSFNGIVNTSGLSFTGIHQVNLHVNPLASGNSYVYGKIDGANIVTGHDTTIDLVGSVSIYAVTDDYTKCALRARVVSATMFD